jgi:hypothetical protein
MMSTPRTRRSYVVVMTLALLLAVGSWAAYAHENNEDLPHFKCFSLAETGGAINEEVKLQTQFGKETVDVKNPHFLCAPTIKKRECKKDQYGKETCAEVTKADLDGLHLLCWKIAPSGPPVGKTVILDSQFGDTDVKVQTGQLLCEPVMKEIKKH